MFKNCLNEIIEDIYKCIKEDNNYVLYSNEVLLHKYYEENIGEMIDVLKNVKLNQNN